MSVLVMLDCHSVILGPLLDDFHDLEIRSEAKVISLHFLVKRML